MTTDRDALREALTSCADAYHKSNHYFGSVTFHDCTSDTCKSARAAIVAEPAGLDDRCQMIASFDTAGVPVRLTRHYHEDDERCPLAEPAEAERSPYEHGIDDLEIWAEG